MATFTVTTLSDAAGAEGLSLREALTLGQCDRGCRQHRVRG